MPYRYEEITSGQVIETEHKLDYLDGLARWQRTEVHATAPAPKPAAPKAATGGRKTKAEKDAEAKAAAEKEAADKAAAEKAAAGSGEDESEGDGTDERPSDDADLDVWKAYALNHGRTEAELDDLSRDDIAELFPAAE
jgi:membrane protein involved in colicin uptake